MAELKEARVPDIGGYDGVPVIEVLVAVGDTVEVDQGLVTLESEKATMEVPSPMAGVVRELKVKLDDEVAEGTVVALIEPAAEDAGESAKADKTDKADQAYQAPAAREPDRAEPVAPEQRTAASETGTKVRPTNVGTPDKLAQREIADARDTEITSQATTQRPPP